MGVPVTVERGVVLLSWCLLTHVFRRGALAPNSVTLFPDFFFLPFPNDVLSSPLAGLVCLVVCSTQEQLFIAGGGLLPHLVKEITSDGMWCAGSLQTAFDLLGELCKGNRDVSPTT